MVKNVITKVCTIGVIMTLFIPVFFSGNGNANPTLSEGDMAANGVAVDSQNNVIVTGQVYDTAKDKWIIRTEKYDGNDGHLIWSKDFDKYNYNIGKDVAVDSNDNIIVVGSVNETTLEGFNYCIIKYTKNGDQVWYKTYNRKFYDTPWRVVVDSANNIFVTGMSLKIDPSSGFSSDYWTIKCASNGNKLEEKVFDVSNADLAFGIALDNSNNVIVTGSSNHDNHLAYCTLKYDSNLNELWGPIYYGSGNENNSGSGVAVDSNNNIIITGGSEKNGDKNYLTVKYNSNGNKLNDAAYNAGGTDDAMGVAVDSKNDIIVTGTSTTNSGEYFCTIKYNSNLGTLWVKKEDGFMGGAKDIAVDSNDNIIVTGYSKTGGDNYYTIKYSPSGEVLWAGGGGSGPAEPPTADFSYTPANPTRADFVHFYDKSTGSITSWQWDFGDGSISNDENPSHKYSSKGTFTVTLTVSGPAGEDTKTKQIVVSNAPPLPSFSYNPPNPLENQSVSFDASYSTDPDGSISSYAWNFGDGSTGSGKVVQHAYSSEGTYTVVLTVTDNDGGSTSLQKVVTVNSRAGNTPPVPGFNYSPTNPSPGEEVMFNASASADPDGIIELYRWDWNSDGTYDDEYTIPTAVHTWYESGEYAVTLQVKDNDGTYNTCTSTVNVGSGSGEPKLVISLGVSDIAPFDEDTERTIPIKVYCYNFSATGVTLSVLEDGNLTVTPVTPALNLNDGEEKEFVIKVKVPKLGENMTAGTKTIKIQAMDTTGVKSNVETIDIVVHKAGSGTPGFAAILAIAAILIALLFMKKMR